MPEEKKYHPTNKWDVLNNLINKIYNLLNSGNIIGVIIIFGFLCIIYIIYRTPAEHYGTLIKGFWSFLENEKFYLIPLSIALIVSLYANNKQYRSYKKEINRLVQERKKLIHGFDKGELKQLKKHTSSNFNFEDSFKD